MNHKTKLNEDGMRFGEYCLPNENGHWALKEGGASVIYQVIMGHYGPKFAHDPDTFCPKGRWKKIQPPIFEE